MFLCNLKWNSIIRQLLIISICDMNLTEQDNSIDSTNADDDEGSLPSSKVQSPNADKNENLDRNEVEQTHDVDIDLTRVDTFEDVLYNDFYRYSDDQITNKHKIWKM